LPHRQEDQDEHGDAAGERERVAAHEAGLGLADAAACAPGAAGDDGDRAGDQRALDEA
jgi:hypothetical protein